LRHGRIAAFIHRTVESLRTSPTELCLKPLQGRPAGEGKVDVEEGDLVVGQIFEVESPEFGESDWRINVVEAEASRAERRNGVDNGNALRNEGADDHRVGSCEQIAEAVDEVRDRLVVVKRAEIRLSQIAVVGVPRNVALQKGEPMAEFIQPAHQRAKGGGMAVAPGGRKREADKDDVHYSAASTERLLNERKISSASFARCS